MSLSEGIGVGLAVRLSGGVGGGRDRARRSATQFVSLMCQPLGLLTSVFSRLASYSSSLALVFSSALTSKALGWPSGGQISAPLTTSRQRRTDSGSPYSTNANAGVGRRSESTGPATCLRDKALVLASVVVRRREPRPSGLGESTYTQDLLEPPVIHPARQASYKQLKLARFWYTEWLLVG